ncbi:preprotein translocase subunit SecA [Luteolibacter ambystomatis]|uniref:Protein translocase subunit SecA n=1 Tax=Luteolibacter ambystomatis TaxID=2824561 RepID=A0A975PGY3_9BACT|nr:preprotein translocase subunit SecA [Luteolibacter ambystomatis]QUE53050.1 preprotein translocase subunit SecA [Luteolibacter ambystomatis]
MIKWILQKIVGSKNQRELRRIRPTVARINEIEEALQREPAEKLLELTAKWKDYLSRYHPLVIAAKPQLQRMDAAGLAEQAAIMDARLAPLREDYTSLPGKVQPTVESIEEAKAAFHEIEDTFIQARAKYLEQILPDAYAVVKNGARRMCGEKITVVEQEMTWQMVHFDVQLVGGIALHRGMIAEMQTGEGKTLTATLPVYLNALTGLGVHIVTVNDYLARRDAEWMGALYKYLGLTVGCIQNQMAPWDRREEYAADITYGTNAEFGFDYLRDNGMASTKDEQVQRGHYIAVIDEVDSILIDEARTPLIISGPSSQSSHQFDKYKPLVEQLVKRQTQLCNDLAIEAKKSLEEGDKEAAGRALFKIKLGQPRNRQLLRLMEDPDMRRLIEKTELSFYQDAQKKELFAVKEELYFTIDEKGHDSDLMEMGREYLAPGDPESFTLPDLGTLFADLENNTSLTEEQKIARKEEYQVRMDTQAEKIHNISQLLKAYCLYERDVQYVVTEGKVCIVDENTGREMPGRRWSDGLHQAVEAKEGVAIEKETQTFATITIQNYFRLYEKLAGMTGTAETEAAEFHDIYKLDVLPIPPNRPNQRKDENDQVFKTRREKYNAVLAKIEAAHAKGQPILVGTASVDASETVSRMLKRSKIPHTVLNAKYHQQEAEIVMRAGQKGAVTVSTNMAGRGTDIKLGPEVPELGGLFVIATERYESRRVDRQLRGRCSRQGDPGRSQFFISFEDDLMRNFAAADRMTAMMERFGMQEGEALEHSWLNKSVETAQKRVEQRNYTWRKRVLEFDDVMNKQREVVYGYRNEVLTTETPRDLVNEIIEKVIPAKVNEYLADRDAGSPDYNELLHWVNATLPIRVDAEDVSITNHTEDEIAAELVKRVKETYERRIENLPPEVLDQEERRMVLVAIDKQWQNHLYNMDALREGVQLRAQGQKDPLIEYKTEAYDLFVNLMTSIDQEALQNLFRSASNLEAFLRQLQSMPQELHGPEETGPAIGYENIATTGSSANLDPSTLPSPEGSQQLKLNLPKRRPSFEIESAGRNALCPCGSGKKYKQCCGREA